MTLSAFNTYTLQKAESLSLKSQCTIIILSWLNFSPVLMKEQNETTWNKLCGEKGLLVTMVFNVIKAKKKLNFNHKRLNSSFWLASVVKKQASKQKTQKPLSHKTKHISKNLEHKWLIINFSCISVHEKESSWVPWIWISKYVTITYNDILEKTYTGVHV